MKFKNPLDENNFVNRTMIMADDMLGVYCASWTDENGVETIRNEFESGYNKRLMDRYKKYHEIVKVLKEMSEEIFESYKQLVEAEQFYITLSEDLTKITINTNDVFCYAADCEEFEFKELPLINSLYKKFGWDGIIALCSFQNKMKPLRKEHYPNFEKAFEYIGNLIVN